MATTAVRNSTTGWLVLWLEPLGEDRWLWPGETFRIRTDFHGDEPAFPIDSFVVGDDRAAGIAQVAAWICR